MIRTAVASILVYVCVASASARQAAPLSAAPHKDPVPQGVAAPIAARLAPGGVRVEVSNGPVSLDFWWVAALVVNAGTGKPAWADVPEGSLVGLVRIPTDFRDIRGRVLKPGVYTLRYGIQPANGDHLGVSPYRDFLLLSPVAIDTDPAPKGHDGTIELSKNAIGGSHPGVWSLDPPVATGNLSAALKTELEHDAIVMEVPLTRDGQPAGALRFGLVLIGRIEA